MTNTLTKSLISSSQPVSASQIMQKGVVFWPFEEFAILGLVYSEYGHTKFFVERPDNKHALSEDTATCQLLPLLFIVCCCNRSTTALIWCCSSTPTDTSAVRFFRRGAQLC